MSINFREALNTISDVVQNRPPPLREFDQIYMKVGDLVIQAEFMARKFDGLSVVFIGDGDSISLSMMHLRQSGIFTYGPEKILVLDFDERIVNSINHFAKRNNLLGKVESVLYNVCDPLPEKLLGAAGAFYTNPPWGASNDGQSVLAFLQRGIEATHPGGMATVVIADDEDLHWTGQVLYRTQERLIQSGYIVCEMIPGLHQYHLDDAPGLSSCCLLARDVQKTRRPSISEPLPASALADFYGRKSPLRVQYVRDLSGLNLGKAADGSYEIIPINGVNE
jgi:N4-bis(aminopropyl)spermidine synthase